MLSYSPSIGTQQTIAIANRVDARAATGDAQADAAREEMIGVAHDFGLRAESATQSVLLLRGRLGRKEQRARLQAADLPAAERKDLAEQERRLAEAVKAMEATVEAMDSSSDGTATQTDAATAAKQAERRPVRRPQR